MATCKNCGKEFTQLTTVQLFCAKKCRNQYHQNKIKELGTNKPRLEAKVDELSLINARIFKGEV